MPTICTELGNSLLDRDFIAPEPGRVAFFAVYRDADLHSFHSQSFSPQSGGEMLIWVTENQTMAKRLGHNWVGIYWAGNDGAQVADPKQLMAAWARTERGDWMVASVKEAIDKIDAAVSDV